MATVGRNSAVARVFGMNWSGPIAWLLWLIIHVYYLIEFRNKLMVLFSWAYNYLIYERSTRAILTVAKPPTVIRHLSDGMVPEPLQAQTLNSVQRDKGVVCYFS